MKIVAILLTVAIPWAVAFPSDLGSLLGGSSGLGSLKNIKIPILGGILGGGGKKSDNNDQHGDGNKHNSLVGLNAFPSITLRVRKHTASR